MLEECVTYDAEFIVEKSVRYCVPLTRITLIPVPCISSNSRTLRSQTSSRSTAEENVGSPNHELDEDFTRTNLEWLQFGLTTRRHAKKGWLKSVLIEKDLLKDDKRLLWQRAME